MVKCVKCNKELDDNTNFCPECGNPIKVEEIDKNGITEASQDTSPKLKSKKSNKKIGCLTVIGIVVAFYIIGQFVPDDTPSGQTESKPITQENGKTEEKGASASADELKAELKNIQSQKAKAIWGNLNTQQTRQTYLKQTPTLLTEIYNNFVAIDAIAASYLKGEISKEQALSKTWEYGTQQSKLRDKVYLLVTMLPKEDAISALHQSITCLDADVGNISLTLNTAIKEGKRSNSISIYLDSLKKDSKKVFDKIDELIADYRIADPKEAAMLTEDISSLKVKYMAIQ